MALGSPLLATRGNSNRIRYPDIDFTGRMRCKTEIVEESPPPPPSIRSFEDKIYVAVGRDLKESQTTLTWALHNSGGRKICLLHVHQPAQKMPILGAELPITQLEQREVRAFHELQRQNMLQLLDKYSLICRQAGVWPEKLYIEKDSVEKGIVELISTHNIGKLVMGAAADKFYSKKMMEPRSKKAIYVRQQAPMLCLIWFVCRGNLIYTREGKAGEDDDAKLLHPSIQLSPVSETGQSSFLKSYTVSEGRSYPTDLALECCRAKSDGCRMEEFTPLTSNSSGLMITPRRSSISSLSDGSPSRHGMPHSDKGQSYYSLSPPRVLAGSVNDAIYDHLDQLVAEAEHSQREAYDESTRRRRADKNAFEAMHRAKTSEALYNDELGQRKEAEEALGKGKEEVERMKMKEDEVMEELQSALKQKALLECQIADSVRMMKEMEQKILCAHDLLQINQKERDELKVERDDAVRVAEELRKGQSEESSSSHAPRLCCEFSLSEIEKATHSFDPDLKIGEGGYGSIYRGFLRNTEVAIKMLNSYSLQGPAEFQQEVDILSKFRHPNLVTLVGACPEAFILVYEYLPNGSLEDRLSCRDNTPPMPWQTRIRIAAELCSVLIFLHSSSPCSIVHGDLKPSNILLDANWVSKLSDFGICRVISSSNGGTTLCCKTDPKGTLVYMDPEFLATGELTPMSDVYSFGIILLRLLTGRPALGVTREVQYALDKGRLKGLLDSTAGDWPFLQVERLAHLAMRCCEMRRRERPDLVKEVWRVLEPLRVSCGGASSLLLATERQIPPYFICPIFQEIMQDPVVAEDGFTYEAEALRGWLYGGHCTSPVTNIRLLHTSFVPNHALRSAIQDWLQLP